MDGAEMQHRVEDFLDEESTGTWLSTRTTYDYLWEGAKRFVGRIECLTSYQDITTVADQVNYVLDAKYLKLYLTDRQNRYYVRYYDQSNYSFITYKDYKEIVYANKIAAADAVDVPDHFSIRDQQSLYSQITGTATSAGAASGGECTLTDTSGLFTTTDYVSAGDIIHNTTDESSGIVLSVTDATNLVCALFGDNGNDWTSQDAYVIQPQGRLELILDPPPDDADDTVRIWYVEVPAPVYSHYGTYRFRQHNIEHIVEYAAAKYKYRDNEPAFAKEFLGVWDRKVREEAFNLRPFTKERKWGVNLKKRR